MVKRSLIMYVSWTGHTEQVALRFKKAFEKKGWTVDMWKVDHKIDVNNPKYDIRRYDFLCVGSPVVHKKPIEELITILAGNPLNPSSGGPEAPGSKPPPTDRRFIMGREAKIVLGPDSKKGVAFCTYGGTHLGPKECEPALSLISLMMEHVPYQVVGRFSCPGKHGENTGWFADLKERPNERDLLKAEIFMEEILEDLE